jgi:hypothetical protein
VNRTVTTLVAVAAALFLLCGSIVGLPILYAGQAARAACVPGGPVPDIPIPSPTRSLPGVGTWNAEQVSNAAIIVATGHRLGVPPRGWVIAVATAMQESSLRNVDHGDDAGPDSRGLFQQRAPWGPLADRMNPAKAAALFYTGGQGGQNGLLDIAGWEAMRLTEAAQRVQQSGQPEAYQKWEDDANTVIAHVLGVDSIDEIGGGDPAAPCGVDDLGPVIVGPNGWTQPLKAPIVSPFGMRGDRLHAGVDLGGPNIRGTPIRAAATGVAIVVTCESNNGTCDRDGGLDVSGCGWYVDLRHPGNIVTRYCHMGSRPLVAKGQTVPAGTVIGKVGSSGNSSGPHLHYEIHVNVPPGGSADRGNATDPVPFHIRVGAPL